MRTIHAAIITTAILSLSVHAVSPRVFDAFAGKWSGDLEYQDYQNRDRRAKIGVKLEVRPDDATSAVWDFKYDDFGKIVPSFETHRFKAGVYTVETKGHKKTQSYKSTDFLKLSASGAGKAVLIGNEIEVGRNVEIRRTITLGANDPDNPDRNSRQGRSLRVS
ncbi:MAG: hypothetical protein HC933_01030 [Pleurocapsa sp. SU_196_0]|nr:hypothetical protein [Pleurocapsa sp. SU_196_0]